MKFYAVLLLFFISILQISFAQDVQIDNDKSELPKIKKESLQLVLEVELYPNPALEYLNVTLKNSNLKNVKFEMYNVIGNKLDCDIEAVNGNSYKIDVEEFNSGYYLLIIKDPISRYNKAFKFRKE